MGTPNNSALWHGGLEAYVYKWLTGGARRAQQDACAGGATWTRLQASLCSEYELLSWACEEGSGEDMAMMTILGALKRPRCSWVDVLVPANPRAHNYRAPPPQSPGGGEGWDGGCKRAHTPGPRPSDVVSLKIGRRTRRSWDWERRLAFPCPGPSRCRRGRPAPCSRASTPSTRGTTRPPSRPSSCTCASSSAGCPPPLPCPRPLPRR